MTLDLDRSALPPVPLDVATGPTTPYPWFDPAYTGRRIAPVMESDDGVTWASTKPPRFCYYPPRELTADEAAAFAERLHAGVEAAALGALDATLDDRSAPPAIGPAAAAIVAYLDAELGPAGEPWGDAGDHLARTYLLDFMTAAAAQLRDQARAAETAPAKRKRGRPRRGPAVVPQQTWPEFEAVILGIVVDGKTATQDTGKDAPWQDAPGEVALTHKRKGSPLRPGLQR